MSLLCTLQSLSISAIIEEAKRTTVYCISGGGIATLLWNGWLDRQLVSHRLGIICPNYLTLLCLQTKKSNSDQDDVKIVKIVVPKFPVIVSSNHQTLLNGRQLMDLQTKTKFWFRKDGRWLMDLPIKTCRILFWNLS